MGRHLKEAAEMIIESVKSYNISIETVTPFVKKYVEKNLKNWQHFSGWRFSDNGKTIIITYWYEEFWSNTETYTEYCEISEPLEDILKMMWSDDMSLEEVIDDIKNKE